MQYVYKRHLPTYFYIFIGIIGLCLGLLIGMVYATGMQVRAATTQQHQFKENLYKQKYDQAVLNHLNKPTPKKTAKVTAYSCGGIETAEQRKMNCPNGVSATGKPLVPYKTVACDRANLHRKFYIDGIGEVTCVDVGGAIKGAGRFDLYVPDIQTAYAWGIREVAYQVIN